MMARSSSAKPFHRAPRKITNAHAATTAYSRQPASASSHRAAGAAAVAVTPPSVLAPARRSRWRQARGAGEQRVGGEGVPPQPGGAGHVAVRRGAARAGLVREREQRVGEGGASERVRSDRAREKDGLVAIENPPREQPGPERALGVA